MTETEIPSLSDGFATHCPQCAVDLCAVPPRAAYCPHCGGRFRSERGPWAAAARTAFGHLRRRRPSDPPAVSGPRSPVVVGYGNALWRLGWRYEHGRGLSRNVQEAIRCYHKSAGLGNPEAAARLDVRAGEPVQVLSLPPGLSADWIPLREET